MAVKIALLLLFKYLFIYTMPNAAVFPTVLLEHNFDVKLQE